MTHFILRAWGYVGLVVLAIWVIIGIFEWNVTIGASVVTLGPVSAYLSLFAKMAYDQKLREAKRCALEVQREAERAERDREWKEAQAKREQDRVEREKLADLERAARQKRIQDLSGEIGQTG